MISSHLAGNGSDLEVLRLNEDGKAYCIRGFNTQSNPVCASMAVACVPQLEVILTFQSGPLADVGRNGLSPQALLAVVADHLEHKSCCTEAAHHVRRALAALVEGSQAKDPEEVPCPCDPKNKKCSAPLPKGAPQRKTR